MLKNYRQRVKKIIVKLVVDPLIPLLAPIIGHMAKTGTGTDACLRKGCLPIPVHFYSPVPDLADLEQRKVWNRRSDMAGIDFHPDNQVALLNRLGEKYGHECDWPADPSADPYQFHFNNGNFSYGCAASTHCLLRHFRPRRVIEIGSGNSSLVIAAALRRNAEDSVSSGAEYTIIDPYPQPIIENSIPGLTRLVKERVELIELDFFKQLNANDVLFIDSGHTVRIGGDVNFLILDVLPRLRSGVIVHFHDIGLPYEYPKIYATNPRFRMLWTEAYLLQAFLCQNSQFEVLLAMAYLTTDKKEELLAAFPLNDPTTHLLTSGSFWIRRK